MYDLNSSDDSDTTIIVDNSEKYVNVPQPTTSFDFNCYSSIKQDSLELQSILNKYLGSSSSASSSTTTSKSFNTVELPSTSNVVEFVELSSDEDENQVPCSNLPADAFLSSKNYKFKALSSSDEDEFPKINLNRNKPSCSIGSTSALHVSDDELPGTLNYKGDNGFPVKKFAYNEDQGDSKRLSPVVDLSPESQDLPSSPKRKRRVNVDKEAKLAAKQAKKQEAEKEKLLKQALASINKNLKPDECLKLITVMIDSEIANEKYAGEILIALQGADVTYKLKSQAIPRVVTWKQETQQLCTEDANKPTIKTDFIEAEEVLLILNWNELVELVHNKSLISHVETLKSKLVKKRFSLAIFGLESYFKHHKSKKQKELKEKLTQEAQKNSKKGEKTYETVAKIDRKQLEVALTELQLLSSCCHRFIDNPQDLGAMIVQYTKSIAQTAFKLEKYEKLQQAEWYVAADNKDCVRVDKHGNGLKRLWQQQITSFPLARLELAEAVTGQFETPLKLFKKNLLLKHPTETLKLHHVALVDTKRNSSPVCPVLQHNASIFFKKAAYDKCLQNEKDKLLQEIPIRRAAGPLTTVRKIGPEFSKKVSTFFNSLDGDAIV